MKSNQKKSLGFIFLVLICGIILGTIFSQIIGAFIPSGVVKDFLLNSSSIGWGLTANNWVDLYVIRFKTGLFIDISVISLVGMTISWYFLRYFK